MKLTTLILLATCMMVSASLYSQSTRLTLKLNDISYEELFKEIENQTEFRFAFSDSRLDPSKTVYIDVVEGTLEKILDKVLPDEIAYEIIDRYVVIINTSDKEVAAEIQQQKSISGNVTDETGKPLPGVTVYVKGTSRGTITDSDGNYSLTNLSSDASLVFSFVGMLTKEISVGSQNSIDVTMVGDAIGIEEVVAIGYGTQKKINMTGSVATVNAETIEKRPITDVSQALQGVTSGVYVAQSSAKPGAEFAQIRIRGEASITGSNDALVLIDGIQAPLNSVNPEDIESISVLKDAASAAIYGSRAANGVVLVTTKRGTIKKATLNLKAYTGIQQATRITEMVNDPIQYMELYNKARQQVDGNGDVPGPFFQPEMMEEYKQYMEETGFKGFDMLDHIYGNNAPITNINLSASGGNEKTTYYLGAGFMDQDGIGLGTDYKRGDFKVNLDANISDKFKTGVTLTTSYGERNEPTMNDNNLFQLAWRWRPMAAPYLPDGRYSLRKWAQSGEWGANFLNPLAYIETGENRTILYQSLGSVYLEYEPIKDLIMKIQAGGNYRTNNNDLYTPVNKFYYISTGNLAALDPKKNSLTVTNITNLSTNLQGIVNYQFNVKENHDFKLMGGYSQEFFRTDMLLGSTLDFTADGVLEIGDLNKVQESADGSASEQAFRSYFGRLNYDYKDKYLFEATIRHDATSRFAKKNRWGTFPSFSVGWRIIEEPFMQDISVFSNLKLKASWGQLGNQDVGNPYLYQSTVLNGGDLNYTFGNSSASPGAGITSLINKNVVWETATTKNLGIEGSIFKGKLNFEFDYFKETRSEQLMDRPVAKLGGGLGDPVFNIAEVDNWGWDLELGHQNKIGDFKYKISLNLSHAENEVKSLGGVEQIVSGYTNNIITKVGYPMYSWFLLESDGLYQTDEEAKAHDLIGQSNRTAGDIKYIDQNGDNIIGTRFSIEDKVISGKSYPQLYAGLTLDLEYKRFDFSVIANSVHNVNYWAVYYGVNPFLAQGGITKRFLEESFTFDKESPTLPRLIFQWNYSGNEALAYPSDFYLQKGGYVRIKNIQLGYSLPQNLISKIRLKHLRVYLNAQNPFLFTKFLGMDPERQLRNANNFSLASYPQSRILTAGLNLTF